MTDFNFVAGKLDVKKMLLIITSLALVNIITTANAEDVGEQTYKKACITCHDTGMAGAPKFGDKAAWKGRIAQGIDTLYEHAIHGFKGATGFKLAKGGRHDLSDDDVIAAVDYMVNSVK